MSVTTHPNRAPDHARDQRRGLRRVRVHRARRKLGDDRGLVEGLEALSGGFFLLLFFLFIAQVVVWWNARNILEQAAAEGARVAAAADTSCDEAPDAVTSMATRLGGDWVDHIQISCSGDDDTEGAIMTVTVHGRTPAFMFPVSLGVTATAAAPEES